MFDTLKNILINNWQSFLAVAVFIASFILQLIKKKPVTSIFEDLYDMCIVAVQETELFGVLHPNVKGVEKLNIAISYVKQYLRARYPSIDVDYYTGHIEETIETILSTPQKKGSEKNG